MPTLTLSEDADLFAPNGGGQADFMDDWENRYIALAGGWYAGKTWAGARKLATLHCHNAFDDNGQPTGVKSVIVGQDYSLARSINIPEMQKAFDEMGLAHRFVADPKRYCFELPDLGTRRTPSEILVRSADAPEKLNGFTVGGGWGDEVARWKTSTEDPTRNPLLQLKGRLRDPKAKIIQAMFTFTHEGDATEVYQDFEESPKPSHKLYRAGTFENPSAREFADNLTDQLTPELAKQYLSGEAASLRGAAVYISYDKAKNVDEKVELSDAVPLNLSIDFNIAPGQHALVGQHFPALDILAERHLLHAASMDVPKMMIAFRQLVEKTYGGWRWPELWVFGDASGAGRWAGSGESCWDIVVNYLKDWGIPYRLKVAASNPHVADRVNSVNSALQDMHGVPHYKIHPDCGRLIDDLRRMKWDAKGEVDKTDRNLSHAVDAAGYRVHWLRPIRKMQRAPMWGGSAVAR